MHYELMTASRKELSKGFEIRYPIAYENVNFIPPGDGSMWLKYHYIESETVYTSLDRKCRYFVGMIQVDVICSPGYGTDKARLLAKEIADFFYDGKMLEAGYVYQGGEVRPIQRSDTGWSVPVRFYVRAEEKRI